MKLPFFNQNKIEYFAKNDQNSRRNKMLLIVLAAIFILAIIAMTILSLPSESQREQQKLSNQIKDSMQGSQNNSNITINNAKQSGNFVSASVGDQNSSSVIFYKKNPDGTLSQIAVQQNYNPVMLLQSGLTLTDIAKFSGRKDNQDVVLDIKTQCDQGVSQFSFTKITTKGSWSLDSNAVKSIQIALSRKISEQNQSLDTQNQIICVAAEATDNAQVVNPNVNVITSWKVQFISAKGKLIEHGMSYAVDMNFQITITLDGQKI